MTTYYVTEEQLETIEYLKTTVSASAMKNIIAGAIYLNNLTLDIKYAVLRYIGNDKTIKFKIIGEETLYCLARIDDEGDPAYMNFNWATGNPDWTMNKKNAFKASLEEIKKWQTPAWEIEEVKE